MTTDPYPSRTGGEQRMLDRQEPVLWGGVDAPGPLTRDQLAQFESDGFIILQNWLDEDTVAACLDDVEALGANPEIAGSEQSILEPDSGALRSLFQVHKTDSQFSSLAADDRLAGVARQIVNDQVYVHQSRVNLKPALHGQSFSWHSDFETWHVEDGMPAMRAVSCSVALTDNHSWNGPLLLIRGSHLRYVAFAGHTPDDNYRTSLRRQEHGSPDLDTLEELLAEGDIVEFDAPAGSVAFFDCNVMHGSPDNISPVARTNGFYVYNAVSNALVEPFGTDTPRPAHIAERAAAPLPVG
ncbi:ectoine hydroxylase [Ilumatobacter nonamiensis]|uniref:ectoine hydroxylase n=1 Tax=Ilumatobacter nonamiensis TaxID=467093 RepID=UPI00034A8C73|nr:ectoine hydroxylase [Ilumatobacter nonamiensis]